MTTAFLNRQAILSAPVSMTEVEVLEWGGSVRVRALSAKSRVLLLDAVMSNEAEHSAWKADQALPAEQRQGLPRVDLYDQSILTVLHCIVDENGDPMFSLDDYDAFTVLDYQTILNLFRALKNHENRAPEIQKKTSASTTKGGSSSASRSRSEKP